MELNMADSAVELIQLSLAPVFLIVGIGQMVNVVTGRLARIIDRARWFEEQHCTDQSLIDRKAEIELKSLRRRMRLANWAITFLTGAAVIVCLDVIMLLLNGLIDVDLDVYIIGMFIVGLASITCGLLAFFLEVTVATATLKIGVYEMEE